jgi:hypothetical protein
MADTPSKYPKPNEKERFLLQVERVLTESEQDGFGGIGLDWQMRFVALAYDLAEECHRHDHPRRSGKPYFSHPVEAAELFLSFPVPTAREVVATLLHDVVEHARNREEMIRYLLAKFRELADTFPTPPGCSDAETKAEIQILDEFCRLVVFAVEALSKEDKMKYLPPEWQYVFGMEDFWVGKIQEVTGWRFPDSWRPLVQIMELRASAHYVGELLKLVDNPDLRWIPRVKLADRLHNLYDSDHETPDQIDKICDETEREYYVLADRVDPEIGRIFRKKVGELRKLAVRKRVEKELEKKASKR